MNATAVAANPAKFVSQIPMVDEDWRMADTRRPTRTPLERWWANVAALWSVMIPVVPMVCGAAFLLPALTKRGQPVKTSV